MGTDTYTKYLLGYSHDQVHELDHVISLAGGEDERAVNQILEAFGNDDATNKAVAAFMDGFTFGPNPRLHETNYNQQLTNDLFRSIADYIVRD